MKNLIFVTVHKALDGIHKVEPSPQAWRNHNEWMEGLYMPSKEDYDDNTFTSKVSSAMHLNPKGLDVLHPYHYYNKPKPLDNLDEDRYSKYEQYGNAITDALPSHYLAHRTKDNAIRGILSDGRILSPFMFQKESGFNTRSTRLRVENKFFNYPKDESSPEFDAIAPQRPLYTALLHRPFGSGSTSGHNRYAYGAWKVPDESELDDYYGDHKIVFKPSVMKHVTASAGDTYFDHYIPHPILNPHPASGLQVSKKINPVTGEPYSIITPHDDSMFDYIEGHIHHPVTTDDVHYVALKTEHPPGDYLRKDLEDRGIKWVWNPVASRRARNAPHTLINLPDEAMLMAKYHDPALAKHFDTLINRGELPSDSHDYKKWYRAMEQIRDNPYNSDRQWARDMARGITPKELR